MSEWWFVALLAAISLIVCLVLVYPLRGYKLCSIILIPVLMLCVFAAYYFSGDFIKWQAYRQKKESDARAQNLLKTIKSPQELINRLSAKLDDTPNSSKGWYLLGRLYVAQNEFKNAVYAFKKAHHFEPDNEQYTVNYAHALWEENERRFNPEVIKLFTQLLQSNPNQADALAMLAMNAFMNHQDKEAIAYWQKLLKLAPNQSEESAAIRKAIAKARQRMASD